MKDTLKNTLKNFLFSTRLTAVLFIVFATAMAFGTFIESWYSIETARIWIYNAWWFELIMLFFAINFAGNIFRYRLLRKEKWAVLLLHISWILIISGAFITRYISHEGNMPIREGQTEKFYYSSDTYVTLFVDGEIDGELKRKKIESDILVSEQGMTASRWWKKLPWKDDFNGQDFKISYAGFIEGAEKGLVLDANGDKFLKIVEAGDGTRHEHYLKDGSITNIHSVLFALNNPVPGAININTKDSVYTISSPYQGDFLRMADQLKGTLVKDSVQPLMLRSLYNTSGMQFVIPDSLVTGFYDIIALPRNKVTEESQDALILDITTKGETKQVKLLGSQGRTNAMKLINLGDLDFLLSYGSKKLELPFSIKLNDFIAEKYPGTEKGYSAFMSKISVNDERSFDYEVFMNHVLDHKGYRFFQASFFPDEKGTILSVNHDFWGTWVTYIGYFMLYAGLMGIMFFGKTRFKDLGVMLKKMKNKKAKITSIIIFFFGLQGITAQETNTFLTTSETDSVIKATAVSKEHAAKFGALVIQDEGGRMKPIHTYASELLRKMSKTDEYNGLNANQVFLSMMQNPTAWYNTEFIYITKKNDSIRKLIGVPSGQKYVKAIDFFDKSRSFKLNPYLDKAFATNTPNQFQKAFRDYSLKLGLLNRALDGDVLRIFPLPNDDNNKWISAVEFDDGQLTVQDSLYGNFIKKSISAYLLSLREAGRTGDYGKADQLLEAFKKNQLKHGVEVMPSDKKIQAEILYNKINVFEKLLIWYMVIGLTMFFLIIAQIFKDNRITSFLIKVCMTGIIILFLFQTAGLIFRWYISGHAPWSNAYESVIYVAWATMGIGLAFGKKSNLTVAATAFVTAIILFGAHMNWLDPAIANLTPVLNSYWLMIHVAVIVGSYGPLTLGMILGVTSLFLMMITTKKNKIKMDHHIKELTAVNELTLTAGLLMLTIGNFLGGQWANESWGRYWGWDPKETWALISIMIYAFVIHMRLIPGLRGRWTFNFASIVAFASIMMTYFGVNFYLTGLHSYASGDKVITPTFVFYSVAFVLILGMLSFWRYQIHFKKK